MAGRQRANYLCHVGQYETKKREAQVEKTMQNWQKISSEHARLLSANITTGLLCLNPVDGNQPGPRVVGSLIIGIHTA
jgi:hypothetical protein